MDHRDREYRAKSAGRVIGELREVTSSWPALHVHMADTVVPPAFLDGVVPELARTPLGARLFVEVRPGVTRRQLLDLARARALIQPGIESLSDHLLGLMRKGSHGLENIRLLKWCRALDLRVQWNLLYGVPGETQDDYDEMFALFPSIRFLPPPRFCQCISVDRDSPYFLEPEHHGIHELRPLAAYRYLYPFDEQVLSEIAYTFEYECRPDARPADVGERLEREVAEWQRRAPLGDLRMGRLDGGRLTLIDRRPGASARTIELDELDTMLYHGCEDISGVDALVAGVAGARPAGDVTDGLVRSRLDRLVEQRLMVRMADRYLALALPAADE